MLVCKSAKCLCGNVYCVEFVQDFWRGGSLKLDRCYREVCTQKLVDKYLPREYRFHWSLQSKAACYFFNICTGERHSGTNNIKQCSIHSVLFFCTSKELLTIKSRYVQWYIWCSWQLVETVLENNCVEGMQVYLEERLGDFRSVGCSNVAGVCRQVLM